jgi:predicted transcriptional regulator
MKVPLGPKLRAASVFAVVAMVFGAGMVSQASPLPLPIALLASFDEALALVSDAAEQRIAVLEQRVDARPRSPCVADLLADVARDVSAACEDARAALDRAIATVSLSPARRTAVLAAIDRQLAEAHRGRATTTDPVVRLEYIVTCLQLRALRDLV